MTNETAATATDERLTWEAPTVSRIVPASAEGTFAGVGPDLGVYS